MLRGPTAHDLWHDPAMLALLASAFIGVSSADSTPRPIKQLLHTRWSVQDGAPAQIGSLAQTTDGYLWLGTPAGLVRFDGVRFVTVVPADTLRGWGVTGLLGARDGSLWIIWAGGTVSRFREGRLVSYGPGQGLPVAFVLTESRTGTIVAGTASGVARFDRDRWTDIGRESGFPSAQGREVWFDRDDTLWVQSRRPRRLPPGRCFTIH